MARIRIEDVVEHLDSEMRSALEDAIREILPHAPNFDRSDLFRAFCRAVGRKCNTWEQVPDNYVDMS